MDKQLERMFFGSVLADAVLLDADRIGVEAVQSKMEDFVAGYMNFRCLTDDEALEKRAILTGFLFSLAAPLVAGAQKGGDHVH